MIAERQVRPIGAETSASMAAHEETHFNTRRPHWARGGRDTWIDFSLRFRAPVGEQLSEALVVQIEAVEERQRARRKADRDRLRRTVEMVVANLFWEYFYRTTEGVSFFRKKDAYPASDRPSWLAPGSLLMAVDQLSALGYIRCGKGSWGLFPGSGDASRMTMCPSLLQHLSDHKISMASLTVDCEGVQLIRLRDANGRSLRTDPNDALAVVMRENLASYNDFLLQHTTSLDATAREIEHNLTREMRIRAYARGDYRMSRRPEFFRSLLYRVFNGDLHSGGRFYGGWWQSIPSSWRSRILIDGSPTVELDFSGFSMRALYHLEGLKYDEDPYALSQLGVRGSAEIYRPHMKIITQALINGAPNSHPERIALNLSPKLPKGLTRTKVRQWIEAKHRPVSHHFCSGRGLKLQSLDAAVAEMVMKLGQKEEIVVLPIHDSFVAREEHRSWLESAMRESYREILGQDPVIH